MPQPAKAFPAEMLNEIHDAAIRGIVEIFATMFGETAQEVHHTEIVDAPRISSIIGFAGPLSGFVSLHFSNQMACKLAEGLLSMPVTTIDDTVRDAVAEMANMVAGGLKKQLNPKREMFKLSIPSVVQGMDISTRGPASSQEILIGVAAGDHRLKVQLVIEAN
jgi:chemotaxis protein CheX